MKYLDNNPRLLSTLPNSLRHLKGSILFHMLQNLLGSNVHAIGADALRASLLSGILSQPQVAYTVESAAEMRRFCNKVGEADKPHVFAFWLPFCQNPDPRLIISEYLD